MTTYQLPSFYDSVELVTRPMDSAAAIPPQQVPISERTGNLVQVQTDGIYVGSQSYFGSFQTLYVNTTTGSDSNAGTRSAPFQTLAHAIIVAQSLFPDSQITGSVYIAMQAGQSFAFPSVDVPIYQGANLVFTFYGDSNYGDFNTVVPSSQCLSNYMSDLQRPVVTFNVTQVNAQWYLNGVNRFGGSVTFLGVNISLPAAPATPSIALYSIYCDVVRSMDMSQQGYVRLLGSIVNMTDITSYWGFIGTQSQSIDTSFVQFGSQFQVNGIILSAINSPTAPQLTARQYFIKMFSGFAGNNQQTGTLQPNTANSTTASGVISVSWADTEALTVTGSKTSQQSFPVCFDLNYGLRNYIYGLQQGLSNQPLNVLSSRLF
jgi:hypothetical protein